MISFKLNGVPTLFIKGFTADDIETMLNFARDANANNSTSNNTILFIDTPITAPTVEAVHKLKDEGFRVVFRDHHGIDGEATNDRDRQVAMASAKLVQLLGDDCLITVRRLHPACSTLVKVGEFAEALAVIADPDPDGLTAAMKAVGIYYDQLDDDAALLDGEPSLQVTGSPMSALLAKGVATLPPYDASRPREREKALEQLFMRWVAAVNGDKRAHTALEAGVEAYDQAVNVARELAPTAVEVAPGVMLVDTIESDLYDPGTLMALIEKRSGCRITVFRKDKGPIAALHGIQYSLAVSKTFQDQVNLQNVLPPQTKSDPKLGVISNVTFLLHVSDFVWQEQVLPALRKTLVALVFLALCLTQFFCLPAGAQYGGTAVGVPKFVFKDGLNHSAGKTFAVQWFKGRQLLIAPYHCVGPAGGYGQYLDPRTLPETITSVDVMNLQNNRVLATAGHALLKWACPVERSNGDLSGDMMAFELPARGSFPSLIIAPPLLAARTKVWILTKSTNSMTDSADRYAAQVVSCYRTALVLKADQAVDALGSSGSPVVNEKGQLVGMMVGVMDNDRRTIACIPAQSIYERLLKEVGQ